MKAEEKNLLPFPSSERPAATPLLIDAKCPGEGTAEEAAKSAESAARTPPITDSE